MNAPRVLCVSGFPDLGGAEMCLLDTATTLGERGVRVEVLNLADRRGGLAHALAERDVPTHHCRIGRLRDPRGAVAALRWFARHAGGFELAIANDARAALYTALGSRLRCRAYLWHVHDLVGSGHRLERLALWLRPARWISASAAVRESLVRRGCAASRTVTVTNGVNVRRFAPTVPAAPFRRQLGVDDAELLVGAVGRLVPWKAFEVLLEAAARLRADLPGARYVIVGEPVTDNAHRAEALRYRDNLLALRDRLGLADRVRFVGAQSNMPGVMAGLDVLVHPAVDEPFGRVLIEAMACERPVVASRGGGVGEIVENGVTGYLVPPRDPAAVAERLRGLADPACRQALGRAGRARAEARFSVATYGDRLASIVAEVLEEQRGPSVDDAVMR
jgi:glycosyltransferase involved in cell wall biosynthesis